MQLVPLRSAAVLLLLLPLAVGCSGGEQGSAPQENTSVSHPDFQEEQAFALLKKQVAFGPRIPNTPPHEAQLEWMKGYLRPLADTVIAQPFDWTVTSGDTLHLTNLFVRFRPELKDRILLVTHWDTRPKSDQAKSAADREKPVPGANDAASGTAVLMQLANQLHQQPPPIGVDMLFVDGEDYGPGEEDMYLGARYFTEHMPAGYPPLYGVLLDMVGDRTPLFPIEPYSQHYAPEVVQRIWSVAEQLGYGNVFVRSPGVAVSDDHIPLNEAGIHTADIIDFQYGPGAPGGAYWHTPQDVPENTSANTLGIVGNVIAELIYRGG